MSEIPNKCDYCGLRKVLPSISDGKVFVELRELYDERVIQHTFPRKIRATFGGRGDDDRTEFCLVSSESWKTCKKPCEYWQLKFPGETLPEEYYLSLYSAKKMEVLTGKIESLTYWMIAIAMIALVISFAALFK